MQIIKNICFLDCLYAKFDCEILDSWSVVSN